MREVVDRGQELALRQVPRTAEDHERRRVDRQALESLDQRVLLLYDSHGLLRVRLLLRRRVGGDHRVAAELIAQRGVHLRRECALAT